MNKIFFLLLGLITVHGLAAFGNPIDATRICEHIKELASDTYQGRKPGTIGEELTIDYISRQYENIGLEKPNGENYLQEVRINTCRFQAPESIQLESNEDRIEWKAKRDYLLASETPLDTRSVKNAELVFAGFGIYAPELGWDDYKDVNVKGKIVVLLADVPGEFTTDSTLWKGDPAANIYSKGFYKRNEASKRGAIGVLTIYKQSKQGFYNWESLSNFIGMDNKAIAYPVDEQRIQFYGLISPAASKQLFEKCGYNGQEYITAALDPAFKPQSLGYKANFNFSNACNTLITHNVVGVLPGTDLKDEVMVYSAHWDHVGINPALSDDQIHNGAVDNASGTAGLIELAAAFKREGGNRRSILFLATTSEEMGLLGAVWYNRYPLFPLSKTAANFNMDSHYPYGRNTHITAVVYGRSELDPYMEEAAKRQGRSLVSNREQNIAMDIFFRSDHFPFAEAGIPSEFAVGYGEAVGHDNAVYQQKLSSYMYKYHQPTDEYEEDFDCRGIAEDAEFIYLTGRLIDQSGVFPMWYEEQAFDRQRRQSRYETDYYRDVTATHLPAVATQGRTMDARTADIDLDGDIDIVLAGEYSNNIILINDGTGRFSDETQQRLPLKSYDTEDIAIEDFDNDGDPDIFFVSEDNFVNEYYVNDGKGYFKDHSERIPVMGKSNAINTLDVNKDGFLDVIIGNDGLNTCLVNTTDGRWMEDHERLPFVSKTTQDIEIGDVDGDGDLDIICANEDDSAIWINDGTGHFEHNTQAFKFIAGKWETREIDLGDVDGDGDLDMFMANVNFRKGKDPQNRLFLNDGKGIFMDVTESHIPEETMHTADADFADLDNDGDLDIIAGNVFGNSYTVYENDGTGRYTLATDRFIPASVRGEGIDIEWADFNGDGKKDLYLGNFRGSDFLLLAK